MIVNVNITANTLRHTIIQIAEKDLDPSTSFEIEGRGRDGGKNRNQIECRLLKLFSNNDFVFSFLLLRSIIDPKAWQSRFLDVRLLTQNTQKVVLSFASIFSLIGINRNKGLAIFSRPWSFVTLIFCIMYFIKSSTSLICSLLLCHLFPCQMKKRIMLNWFIKWTKLMQRYYLVLNSIGI